MKKMTGSRLAAWMMLAAVLLLCCACGKEPEHETDGAGKVQTLDTAEEISAFIEKIYEEVGESNMPMMIEHRELDLSDVDGLSYNTGLTDAKGLERVVVSESMTGSIPYSMLYITVADGTSAEDIQKQVMEQINPAKWICVSAEKQASVTLGDDIFFVMGDEETVEEVVDAALQVAEAEFSRIGTRQEKNNAF